MDKTEAFKKLASIGQQHLLDLFNTFSEQEKKCLLNQIKNLDISKFKEQQALIFQPPKSLFAERLDTFDAFSLRGDQKCCLLGEQIISEGKTGCILVAGGQATRLKIKGPKGSIPVSFFKNKTLFELFAEKVVAAGKKVGEKLPLAIMNSPLNHEETVAYFKSNDFFGLKGQLDFFVQEMLPILDCNGNLFLEEKGRISEGPDGNGSLPKLFCQSGIWKKWYEKGIRYVSFLPVDNALADPFDPELFGYQLLQGADLVVKCSERQDPEEKVGVLVKQADKVKVIEYSELPEEEKFARDAEKNLKHRLANLSLFSFSMDFIKKVSEKKMPLHLAKKAVSFLKKNGELAKPKEPNAWKIEKFIFDIIPYALKASALVYPREECFAPLKNAAGKASLSEVQKALVEKDKRRIHQITGEPPPAFPIELSQDFYYPTQELLKKWKGKRIEKGGYISSFDP